MRDDSAKKPRKKVPGAGSKRRKRRPHRDTDQTPGALVPAAPQPSGEPALRVFDARGLREHDAAVIAEALDRVRAVRAARRSVRRLKLLNGGRTTLVSVLWVASVALGVLGAWTLVRRHDVGLGTAYFTIAVMTLTMLLVIGPKGSKG